jgi:uncharacterized membrane protein
MAMTDLIGLLSRWVHVVSAVTLMGGVLFARQVLRSAAESELITRYAQVLQVAIVGLLVSGLYNLLSKAGVPKGYHMIFGIKFLLALHVFAMGFLVARAGVDAAKRQRQLTGMVISGGLILALSAYLRFLGR